jgi:hypothetical protein
MLATILKRSIRHLAWVGLAVALGCSSADEATEPELATMVVEILPASLTILPGGSESFTVTVTHSEDFTGTVHLTVIDAPAGITGTVSGLQTIGQVTTATVTIGVDDATSPANYTLVVRAFAVGAAPGAARLSLTVAEVLLSCPLSGQCEQWAIDATASSEYTTGDWSARQATGRRNLGFAGTQRG